MKRNITLRSWLLALVAIASLASCYKFGRIAAPKEVSPNEPYAGRIVVVNDNNNGPVTTYGIFAVRVPVNWDVQVEEGAYEQYAKEGVVIPADENDPGNKPAGPGSLKGNMHYSALLSSYYNQSNPKEGYTWVAFITDEKHRAGLQGSESNSCDSVAFNYKVINDGVAGEYELDYIIGDEEDNIERFNSVQDALGTRVYCTSTESSTLPKNDDGEEAFDHVQSEFKTTVRVLEGGTPVVHKPEITVDNENPAAGESVTVHFKNMGAGTNISIYRATDIVPQRQSFAVEGAARFNEGSFTTEGLEPGTYHVRATDVTGLYVANQQEADFTIGYPEFEQGDYNFIVMSDFCLLNAEALVAGEIPEDADYAPYMNTSDVLPKALDKVIEQKPSALFVTGNLTMAGALESHRMVAGMLQKVKAAGINVYVIPGSNDINNPNAKSYNGEEEAYAENIQAADFAKIYAEYGFNEAIDRDESSLSYVIYPNDNLAVICLDDNRYNENERLGDTPSDDDVLVSVGRVTTETLEWMKDVVRKASGRKIIVMMNHLVSAPFDGYDILGSVVNNEAPDLASFFGSSDEEETQEDGYEVSNLDVKEALLDMNVWAVFCGSLQAADIQKILFDDSEYSFYQVVTPSMRTIFSNYRQVTVKGDELNIITRPVCEKTEDVEGGEDYPTAEAYLCAAAPLTVAKTCAENWDIIEPIFKENFTFDYDPEVDIFNKNDFMRLPESPEDMATRVNNTLTQPMLNIITAFYEGNEQQKDSQKLVDDLKAGFDAFFDSLNTFPSIVTPMIKEGFAAAGLDTDAITDRVAGSLAHNYLGTESNVTNDLFVTLPYSGKPTSVSSIATEKNTATPLYDLQGRRLQGMPVKGVYIQAGRKVVK